MNEIEMKARIAELEANLASVQQGVQPTDAELQAEAGWLSASNPQSNGIDSEVQLMRNALHKWGFVAPKPTKQGLDVAWVNFPSYLIDHCEGDTISEEGLQRALSAMLQNPKYAAQAKQGGV